MDITDGETRGGDGLPGPASRKLQGTDTVKRKEGEPTHPGNTSSGLRPPSPQRGEGNTDGVNVLPVGLVTPEQLVATQQYLQLQFKSVTTAIMVFLAGGVGTAEILHPFIHDAGGGHKTAPVQNTTRREDRGDARVKIQRVEDEDDGGSGTCNDPTSDRTEMVPCQAVGFGCKNRVPSGFCHFRQHLCLVAPHPDRQCEVLPDGHLAEILQELRQQRDWLRQLDLKLEKVANNESLLRMENKELRQLNAEGYLNFALRVKGDDFLAFAVIMALGNRKAAADHLGLPHRSFYDRVNLWARGTTDQQRMFRLVEWRKKTGRKIVVRLEDSVQSGEPNDGPENPVTVAAVLEGIAASDSRDFPAILREILEVLQLQNPKNWAELGREAMGIIREEIG